MILYNNILATYIIMPKKNKKDKKQDARIKALESMLYKTVENKQVEYVNTNLAISSSGVRDGQFLTLNQGTADGNVPTGTGGVAGARIGNTITLMRQQFNIFLSQNPTGIIDDWNRMRVLIVEALDGNQPILISDVLEYHNYSVFGDLVFSSPYTTKTTTNRRYKVCYDSSFELNKAAKGATKSIKYVKKWKNGKEVEFEDDNATPTNHQLTLLFISDSTSLPHPLVNYSVRSTYKDA